MFKVLHTIVYICAQTLGRVGESFAELIYFSLQLQGEVYLAICIIHAMNLDLKLGNDNHWKSLCVKRFSVWAFLIFSSSCRP